MNKKPTRPSPSLIAAAIAAMAWVALPTAAAAQSATPTSAPRAQINDFKVTGNTLLPAGEIDAALAPFKGQRSLDDLKAAAAAVQELYRRAGYGAVIAYVPEQSLSGGVATVAVLEGKIAKVVVIGNQQFSADNVRRSLPALQEGQTPRIGPLDQQIQLANENAAKQVAVTLEPGAKQGEVDARISVTERPVSRWTLALDNTGNAQTGHARLALGWRHANVADLDHQASLQYQTSPTKPSKVSVLSASYSLPLYGAGMRMDAYAAYSNVDGGTNNVGPGSVAFVGKGNVYGARLNKLLPRLGEFDQRATLGFDRRDYLNNCRTVDLAADLCGPAKFSVTVNPLLLEWGAQRSTGTPAGVSLSFTGNLDLGGRYGERSDFNSVRGGAPLRYSLWRLGAFLNPELGGDWRLAARVSAQATGDALVPGEQFGLAGAGAVRGYTEREVIGDSGALASVEVLSPDFFASAGTAQTQSLRLAAFIDGGQVTNKGGAACRGVSETRCSLASVGLGLRWSNGPGQLRLDVARAGQDGTRTDSGSWKLHLAGSWAFE